MSNLFNGEQMDIQLILEGLRFVADAIVSGCDNIAVAIIIAAVIRAIFQ